MGRPLFFLFGKGNEKHATYAYDCNKKERNDIGLSSNLCQYVSKSTIDPKFDDHFKSNSISKFLSPPPPHKTCLNDSCPIHASEIYMYRTIPFEVYYYIIIYCKGKGINNVRYTKVGNIK